MTDLTIALRSKLCRHGSLHELAAARIDADQATIAYLLATFREVIRDSGDCFCEPDKQFYCSSCKGRAAIAKAESSEGV